MNSHEYLLSCVAGLEEVVGDLLQRDFPRATVDVLDSGLLALEGKVERGGVLNVRYASNSFGVLRKWDGLSVRAVTRLLLNDRSWLPLAGRHAERARDFRLVFSEEGRLFGVDAAVRASLVRMIEKGCDLRHVPRGGGAEFWLMRRSNGSCFWCVRLSRRNKTERDLAQGELRPELTEVLCELSEPEVGDVFLDPFAGSGAIVFSRAQLPYNLVFAYDLDENKVRAMRRHAKHLGKKGKLRGGPIIVRSSDARELTSLEDGFVDRIVTDPPWGHFDRSISDLGDFYFRVFCEFTRVTKAGGVIVVLLGRTEPAERVLTASLDGLELAVRCDILVSGKKATVGKWRRR